MFADLFAELSAIGRDPTSGGIHRHAWDDSEMAARAWFARTAGRLDMEAETDRNGNLWAWWASGGEGCVATGSHLDSVANGGAFDGALGVVSAFAAVDVLKRSGHRPQPPLAVVAFVEEEGARFGVPTLGSRLLTGAIGAAQARLLVDRNGVSLDEAMTAAGADPTSLGPEPERLHGLRYVELHIEQGKGLQGRGAPVGAISEVWPHGRWRLDLEGRSDHAGTAAMEDRRDAMVAAAEAIRLARATAERAGVRATVGRIAVDPNVTNTVPGHVSLWLDARAAQTAAVESFVAEWVDSALAAAETMGVMGAVAAESVSSGVVFDPGLTETITAAVEKAGFPASALPTAAGHDAAVLGGAGVPAAMLQVRNATGISHAPEEHADRGDCEQGVAVLAAVLRELTG